MPEVEGDWDTVHGGLVTFPDAVCDLPPIDRLEGFRPNGGGLYGRALAATEANGGVEAAWVYHMARSVRGNASVAAVGRRPDRTGTGRHPRCARRTNQ
ncbi:MAG: gamma-glutamylcyclotransferase [Lentisphaeria bacterium]|nr:gamma-glutamylcyclotransferase [Lentisphaeria bacterium]